MLQIAVLHFLPDPATIASGFNSSQAVLGAPPVALSSASGEGPIRPFLDQVLCLTQIEQNVVPKYACVGTSDERFYYRQSSEGDSAMM